MRGYYLLFTLLLLYACTKDKIEPNTDTCAETITYNSHIKSIIDEACAYSGCHNGTAPGDYSSYSLMQPTIKNGDFKLRVIDQQDMPPAYATDGPTSLTEEELMLINCWINDGYLEE